MSSKFYNFCKTIPRYIKHKNKLGAIKTNIGFTKSVFNIQLLKIRLIMWIEATKQSEVKNFKIIELRGGNLEKNKNGNSVMQKKDNTFSIINKISNKILLYGILFL